ncbi:ribonuclease HII [candidate division WOR-3 bacterium JGI_Cruoil_03_51_56]|uniref:Ribonuclease HII n=1 Tax=candidate division WOR-3 bacterium JGI_Cruoil_03_51_56 TaxID=1973747 RepID=A0A235BWC6_UNCW3|nr:MAG: ribonuclease HII [candidate division WOR-3 bacterium JGI_Cruoil_03_51_56]
MCKHRTLFCGVDEAGRGALAGPVVAAAVIMPRYREIPGVNDSKKLSPTRRENLSRKIKEQALSWAIGKASNHIIDRDNILVATFRAMRQAIGKLSLRPGFILADGWQIPDLKLPCTGIIHGDQRSYSIACASILAKVHRDRLMRRLEQRYPGYGLAKHKGYPTPAHIQALNKLGASPVHRLTFAPVRNCPST